MKKNTNGFSILISVIFISTIALSVGLSLIVLSSYDLKSYDALRDYHNARHGGNACAEEVIELIRETEGDATSDSMTINGGTCTYTITDQGGETRDIAISHVYGDSTALVDVTIDSFFGSVNIVSWDES